MGEMRIITSMHQKEVRKLPVHMRRSGDSKVIWDPDNATERKAAEAQFDILIKDGYRAYKVDKEGNKKGSPIKKFDPKAGLLIMIPGIVGG
jgi:hypothetical protein